MTNLEYMKQSIFNQINAMTAEDFYSFMYLQINKRESPLDLVSVGMRESDTLSVN